MSFSPTEAAACERLARIALEEDLGTAGGFGGSPITGGTPPPAEPPNDLTSQAIIPHCTGQALFVARPGGVLAGLPAAGIVCALVDKALSFEPLLSDGSVVPPGTRLAIVRGPMRSLLAVERTALNFMQRLSGIATLTARYVALIDGLPCRVLDTRKTTPGWRLLEKYAVRQGGGHNHRMGLHDGILIKDNHLAALQIADCRLQIAEAVAQARAKHGHTLPVEVEVDTLDQFDAALDARADVILLDNMRNEQLREAVRRRDAAAPEVLLEASGGITFTTLRAIAETGVDRVSIGALTHSATALDIGLDYLPDAG